MKNTFTLQVVTVTRALFEGEAIDLHCTGLDGEMSILPYHEPLITRLSKSTLYVRQNEKEQLEFKILDGIVEVANNKVVVLCSPDDE